MRNSTLVVAGVAPKTQKSRVIALAMAALVAGCGGGSSGPVGPSSVGDGSGGGSGGGGAGGMGGGGGGGMGGAGGTGDGGSGGTGGGGSGGMGGGSGGGSGGGGGGGAACDPAPVMTLDPAVSGAGIFTTDGSGSYTPRIAADGTYVYFVGGHNGGGSTLGVYRVANGGGKAQRLGDFHLSNDDADSFDFAVDGQSIYVMSFGDTYRGTWHGYVNVYDKSGTLVRVIQPTSGNDCSIPILHRLALYGGALFWEQSNQLPLSAHEPCTPTAGGFFADESPPRRVAPAGAYWHGHNALIADGSHLFWAGDTAVYRVDRAGGAPEKLADIAGGSSLATDGNSLFVVAQDSVYAVTAPGSARVIYSGRANDLAWDGTHLYVASADVVRMKADGSDVANLSAGVTDAHTRPYRLAVDDTRVYFRVFDESKIIGLCK